MKRDEYGWIDGNEYDPREVEGKKYYHRLILVCDTQFEGYVTRPVSNGCPTKDFFWIPLPPPPMGILKYRKEPESKKSPLTRKNSGLNCPNNFSL